MNTTRTSCDRDWRPRAPLDAELTQAEIDRRDKVIEISVEWIAAAIILALVAGAYLGLSIAEREQRHAEQSLAPPGRVEVLRHAR